jgi:hypothetical protein
MESTFLSKENLDNIYHYLNSKTVHDYNVNLDTNEKYKKIVKKLSKTIFKSLNSKIQNMTINEFNELVVNKSLPFIKQNIDKEICKLKGINATNAESSNSNMFEKPINYSSVTGNELNIDLNKSLKLVGDNKNKSISKKTKMKPKKNKQKDNEYDSYLKDAIEFENLIKQSNSKIKNNFKDLVKKTQNNFVKQCESEDVSSFVMNRCIAKDAVKEKGLSKSAFEEIVENKTINNLNRDIQLNNMNDNQNNNQNNNQNQTNLNNTLPQNYPTSSISNNSLNNSEVPTTSSQNSALVDYYDKHDINYKRLFSEILVNQKDFSGNNKVDSYEGETYLPNLIANYGEEAPIQPLLYQNTKSGSEILTNYSMIIDTGNVAGGGFPSADNEPDKVYDLTTETYNSVVALTGIFPWQKFRIDLEDTFQLDKITDVYLKSFSLIGPTTMDKCMFFVLDIEEFNLRSYSNNPHLKSKVVIQNTTSGTPSVDTVFTKSYDRFSNYLTTITPSNYTTLNFEVTNENSEGADDGDNKTFLDRTSQKNRIIFELDFVTRKLKDPIFDYTISKETLETGSP